MKGQVFIKMIAMGLIGGICMLCLFGCSSAKQQPRYTVDLGDQKGFFKGVKEDYAAGDTVEFYYNLIATDTDYTFYLDGERFNALYDDDKGYVIRFTMPEHNVTFSVTSRNTMVWDGFSPEETLTYHSYDGGGPRYTVTIKDPAIVACEKTVEYAKSDHSQLEGAGYDVTFTLTGKVPGETTVTVTCDFKGEPTKTVYTAVVNEQGLIRLE